MRPLLSLARGRRLRDGRVRTGRRPFLSPVGATSPGRIETTKRGRRDDEAPVTAEVTGAASVDQEASDTVCVVVLPLIVAVIVNAFASNDTASAEASVVSVAATANEVGAPETIVPDSVTVPT